jgi:hypothetical protein
VIRYRPIQTGPRSGRHCLIRAPDLRKSAKYSGVPVIAPATAWAIRRFWVYRPRSLVSPVVKCNSVVALRGLGRNLMPLAHSAVSSQLAIEHLQLPAVMRFNVTITSIQPGPASTKVQPELERAMKDPTCPNQRHC